MASVADAAAAAPSAEVARNRRRLNGIFCSDMASSLSIRRGEICSAVFSFAFVQVRGFGGGTPVRAPYFDMTGDHAFVSAVPERTKSISNA